MKNRLLVRLAKIAEAHVYREERLVNRISYKKNVFPVKQIISPRVPKFFLFALKISLLAVTFHLSPWLFFFTLFALCFYWGVQMGVNEAAWKNNMASLEAQFRRFTMPSTAITYHDTYIPAHCKDEAGNYHHSDDPMRIWHWIRQHHAHPHATVLAAKIEPILLNFYRAVAQGDLDAMIAQYTWHARDDGCVPSNTRLYLQEQMRLLKRQLEAYAGVKRIIKIHLLDPVRDRHTVEGDVELEFNNGTRDIGPEFCFTPDLPQAETETKSDDQLLALDWKLRPPFNNGKFSWLGHSPQCVGLHQAADTCARFFRAVMENDKQTIAASSISIRDIPGVPKDWKFLAGFGLCIADLRKTIKVHGGMDGIALNGHYGMRQAALYTCLTKKEENSYTYEDKDRIKNIHIAVSSFYVEYNDHSTVEYMEYYDASMKEYWAHEWMDCVHSNTDFFHKENVNLFFHEGKWKVITCPPTEPLRKMKARFRHRILPWRAKCAIY